MPRFFFDILGGEGETTDDVGQDFPDARAAFDAAVDVLSEVAKGPMLCTEDNQDRQAQELRSGETGHDAQR